MRDWLLQGRMIRGLPGHVGIRYGTAYNARSPDAASCFRML